MSNLSKREKILLIIMVVAVLGFLYYRYAAVPLLNILSSETIILNSNKNKLNSLIESKNNIDKIKKQYEELNIQMSDSVKIIPDSGKIPEIIMDIKNITDSSGCIGIRMYFGDKNSGNSNAQGGQGNKNTNTNVQNNSGILTTIPIGYEISGNFDNIMLLLSKIQSNSRKMIVDKLSIIKDDKTGKLTASIEINCYFLKKDDSFKPVEYPFINSNTGKHNIFD